MKTPKPSGPRITLPTGPSPGSSFPQTAFDPAKNAFFEDLSFSPADALAAHRPLGGINRARLVAYQALSPRRRSENGKPTVEITSPEGVFACW